MQPSIEQTCWLLEALQPEKTLGFLPGAATLSEITLAGQKRLAFEILRGWSNLS